MVNLFTQELTIQGTDGWVKLGDEGNREHIIDIFNDGTQTVRLSIGHTSPDGTTPSIPLVSGANYYLHGDIHSPVYVKTESPTATANLISYVEGQVLPYGNTNAFRDIWRAGWADYNNSNTTPISIPNTNVNTTLTNDGAGVFTNKTFLPQGVTDIWNGTTSRFDFSELKVGDRVHVRIELEVITSSPNAVINDCITFSLGGTEFDLPLSTSKYFKDSDTYDFMEEITFYIGSEEVRTLPAKFHMRSDTNCTARIIGMFVEVQTK